MSDLRSPSLFLLVAFVGALAPLAVATEPAPLRVGEWEIAQRATFAVASDFVGKRLHIVFGDTGRLYYSGSGDGGATWSAPEFVARGIGQTLAVDRRGTLHVVSQTGDSKRIQYRSRTGEAWSEPRDLSAGLEGGQLILSAPCLAIDGADNLHLTYWSRWKGSHEIEKQSGRCVYLYRRAGANDFDPPQLWRDQAEKGYARYGSLVVDSSGDMHIFYAAGLFMRHGLERRIRHQDGSWGRHDLWPGQPLSDWCIGAAVTSDGVVHVSVQSRIGGQWKVVYMNNRENPDVLAESHDFGQETFETFTQMHAEPNGDLWLATGHVEEAGVFPGEHAAEMPNIGTYARYTAAKGTWSARTPVSPEGAINLDTRRSSEPRIVVHAGQVRLFYAEQLPNEKWRHWQRILGSPAAP